MDMTKMGAVTAIVFGLFFTTELLAQTNLKCEIKKTPVAIVASGGSSLGAYQAGAYRRILDALTAKKDHFELKLLAGASAGGINSILALQDYCGIKADGTQTAWLEDFWSTKMGRDLFAPGERTSLLNSETTFRALESRFAADWNSSKHVCDVVLSIPLTLQKPIKVDVSGDIRSNYQFLNFSVRMTPGSPAGLENHANIFESPLVPLLDLPSGKNAETLLKLARATAALPLIFNPEKIPYCLVTRNDDAWLHEKAPFRCRKNDLITSPFMDGALLESAPISQAHSLLRRGLHASCERQSFTWLGIPTHLNSTLGADNSLIINLNVHNRDGRADTSLLSAASGLSSLFSNLLQSARDRDVVELLETYPDLKSQILTLRSSLPRWSEEWNGFFGFFDKELRLFDYWLGYAEMNESLQQDYPALFTATDRKVSPLGRCLMSWQNSSRSRSCDGLTKKEGLLLEIILRERLKECQNAHRQDGTKTPAKICESLRTEKVTPQGPGAAFAERMDELSRGGFAFTGLELDESQTRLAPSLVKSWLTESSSNLTAVFPEDSSTSLSAVSEFLLGSSVPIPNRQTAHLAWGSSAEVGYSRLLSSNLLRQTAWRWPFAVEVVSPRGLASVDNHEFAATLFTGLELEGVPSAMQTWLLGVRAGYQMASESDNHLCAKGSIEACQGLSFEPYVAAVFFGRFRLQAALKTSFTTDQMKSATAGLFLGGLQF